MKCPGQDTRYWGPEAVSESGCPNCGGPIEFFKDESSRKCRKCGTKVLNPKMDFGCATYCKFAAQCLGSDMPPELLARRTDLLKDRVAAEVKKFLGRNFKRIGRALKVVEYAGKIQQAEGGDPAIVTLAACLSAIAGGASTNGGDGRRGFTAEDIDAAQSILSRVGAPEELASEVISVLVLLSPQSSVLSPVPDDSANFKCVSDAIRIAELTGALKTGQPEDSTGAVFDGPLLTQTGKRIMEQVLEESATRKATPRF